MLDQVRSLDLGAIRQLDATGEDGTPLLELCIDPDEGPDAQLERTELASACSPGPRASCPSASGRSSRSTTRKS